MIRALTISADVAGVVIGLFLLVNTPLCIEGALFACTSIFALTSNSSSLQGYRLFVTLSTTSLWSLWSACRFDLHFLGNVVRDVAPELANASALIDIMRSLNTIGDLLLVCVALCVADCFVLFRQRCETLGQSLVLLIANVLWCCAPLHLYLNVLPTCSP